MGDTSSAASGGDGAPRVGVVLPGLMVAMLLGALDQTVMTPALPAIAGELGGLEAMPVILTAYFAAATVVMPLYGKLGDRLGRRRVLEAAILLFVVGAVVCAVAPSLGWLLAGRVVQGFGGGGLMIGAQAVLGEVVSPRERGRYLGRLGAVYVVAAVGGPLLGGLVVDQLDWRWVFLGEIPLGVVALVAIRVVLRGLPVPRSVVPIDYWGASGLGTGVLGIVVLTGLAGQDVPRWVTVGALAAVLVGLTVWGVAARRAADPVLPLRLFRDRAFWIPGAVSFLVGFSLFGAIGFLPAFLQVAVGTSATRAGLTVTALMFGVIVSMSLSGSLITRTGRYRIYPTLGTAIAAGGLGSFLLVTEETPLWILMAVLLVTGLGIGFVMQVMTLIAQNAVEFRDLGTATSTVTFLRQIGVSVGIAVVGALTTLRFAERLPASVADRVGDAGSLSPEVIATLSPRAQDLVASAYGVALPPVLGALAPLLAIACLLTLAIPARPLRDRAHTDTNDTDAVHAPEHADSTTTGRTP
ncbi:MFS transporter [Spiractinospora alimapuensis]|uniref:MFS transporter n=1 Tax=Spiractinospora alimapuensis TaxID=2820884 RepID=UPI001F332DB6|nr:MFS transporter [Spiractinospora alimapuensis]QVQ50285.1 MFS transporter [Spiractinospora alimapuensis]